MRQQSFEFAKHFQKEFGGSLLLGKRKSQRPLSLKTPIHLVLKADQKAVFNPGNRSLDRLIRETAEKFEVRIYDIAINWSHVHFVIKIKDRQDYVKFVRALSSLIAQAVRKAQGSTAKLFSLRPYTRIVGWGRDFKSVIEYLILNQQEAAGLIRRKKKSSQPGSKAHSKTPK